MSLNFCCLVCREPIAEARARRKAKFCSNACRFEAERRLKEDRQDRAKERATRGNPRVEKAI